MKKYLKIRHEYLLIVVESVVLSHTSLAALYPDCIAPFMKPHQTVAVSVPAKCSLSMIYMENKMKKSS